MAGKNPNVPWWEEISPEEAQEWNSRAPQEVEKYVQEKWREWNAEQANLAPGIPNKLAYEAQEYDPAYAAAMQSHQANQIAAATANALAPHFQSLRPPTPQPRPDWDFIALSSKNPKDVKTAKNMLAAREFVNDQVRRASELRGLGDERARDARERAAMMVREIDKTHRDSPYSFVQEHHEFVMENAKRKLEEAESLSPDEIKANREHFKTLAESFNAHHEGEFSYVLDERDDTPKVIRVDHAGRTAEHISQVEKPDFLLPWRPQDHVINEDIRKKEETEEAPKAADDKWDSQKEFEEQRVAEGARKF